MIESEGWKEEIQKHVFIVNLENRRDMEEEEMEGSEEDDEDEDQESEEMEDEEQTEEVNEHDENSSSHSEDNSDPQLRHSPLAHFIHFTPHSLSFISHYSTIFYYHLFIPIHYGAGSCRWLTGIRPRYSVRFPYRRECAHP